MFHSFNLLDWAIFITLVVSILIGFFWGLLRTLVSLAIWALSFFASMLAGPTLSGFFGSIVGYGGLQLWLTYGVVFVATIIISAIARIFLRFMLTPNQVGFFDRLGGAGFGLIRGILIVSVFLWFMALTGLSSVQGGLYQTSVLAGWFQPYVKMVSSFFPRVAGDIQHAGQQLGVQQNQGPWHQSGSNNNNTPPATSYQDQGSVGGPNPYTTMGPAGSQQAGWGGGSGSGLLSAIPGMQGIMPWISSIWNMMMRQIASVL